MDTVIVAVFTICEDMLRAMRHKDDIRSQMSDAEVMTTAVVAMLYFSGNFERARIFLQEMGYIPKEQNRHKSIEEYPFVNGVKEITNTN